jgi:hypothetical protein
MLKLELNTGYTAMRVRNGESSRGPWELIVVKEEGKGKKEITIWTTNSPSGVTEGNMFTIKNISMVKYGARKDGNGNWRDDVSLEAEVEPMGYTDGVVFEDLDDMPFSMGSDPFADAASEYGSVDPFAESDNKLPL